MAGSVVSGMPAFVLQLMDAAAQLGIIVESQRLLNSKSCAQSHLHCIVMDLCITLNNKKLKDPISFS